jgi:antitoxin VapB
MNVGKQKGVFFPIDYETSEKELLMNKIGHSIILFPKNDPWELFTMSLSNFSDDFMVDGRQQPDMQTRDNFL